VGKAKNTPFSQVNGHFFALPLNCAFSLKFGIVRQVGSADPHGIREHDYPARARRAGLWNIVDDDISRRPGDCREHRPTPF
jgi:hypothetical protein